MTELYEKSYITRNIMRFNVLTVLSIKIMVFGDKSYSVVDMYQYLEEPAAYIIRAKT
jgi:hypothetical protein